MDTQGLVVIIFVALFLIVGGIGGHYATKTCQKEYDEANKSHEKK